MAEGEGQRRCYDVARGSNKGCRGNMMVPPARSSIGGCGGGASNISIACNKALIKWNAKAFSRNECNCCAMDEQS